MIIVGARGFAKEVLEVLYQLKKIENIVFYDDVNQDAPKLLYDKFPVLRSIDEVSLFFGKVDNKFTIGIGNPIKRKLISDKFISLGGMLTSTVSPLSNLGKYEVKVDCGTNILAGVNISNSVIIGKGCIIYYNSVITHDCKIGDFVEISPSVNILGKCKIGAYSHIGSNATILPGVEIGTNVKIGAGAVVTKNIPSNSLVVGVPGKIIKYLQPLNI